MKLTKYILILFTVIITSCSLDEVWYDRVVPETFFKTEGDVLAALYRPFTHARWYLTGDRWVAQEFSGDHFARTTKDVMRDISIMSGLLMNPNYLAPGEELYKVLLWHWM
mgnify:CR=1 FL=1